MACSDDYHKHTKAPGQCSKTLVKTINAPLDIVWSFLRRFDKPQKCKAFIRRCTLKEGSTGGVGSIRYISVVTGMPARYSIERLDDLNDENHSMSVSILGGDHRLVNHKSWTSAHEDNQKTVVVESYVVDVPEGNTEEETAIFVNTIIKHNLVCLACVSERMV